MSNLHDRICAITAILSSILPDKLFFRIKTQANGATLLKQSELDISDLNLPNCFRAQSSVPASLSSTLYNYEFLTSLSNLLSSELSVDPYAKECADLYGICAALETIVDQKAICSSLLSPQQLQQQLLVDDGSVDFSSVAIAYDIVHRSLTRHPLPDEQANNEFARKKANVFRASGRWAPHIPQKSLVYAGEVLFNVVLAGERFLHDGTGEVFDDSKFAKKTSFYLVPSSSLMLSVAPSPSSSTRSLSFLNEEHVSPPTNDITSSNGVIPRNYMERASSVPTSPSISTSPMELGDLLSSMVKSNDFPTPQNPQPQLQQLKLFPTTTAAIAAAETTISADGLPPSSNPQYIFSSSRALPKTTEITETIAYTEMEVTKQNNELIQLLSTPAREEKMMSIISDGKKQSDLELSIGLFSAIAETKEVASKATSLNETLQQQNKALSAENFVSNQKYHDLVLENIELTEKCSRISDDLAATKANVLSQERALRQSSIAMESMAKESKIVVEREREMRLKATENVKVSERAATKRRP